MILAYQQEDDDDWSDIPMAAQHSHLLLQLTV
jgi:hypothetical protein